MSSISSFDSISVVLCEGRLPDLKMFLCIPASAALLLQLILMELKHFKLMV